MSGNVHQPTPKHTDKGNIFSVGETLTLEKNVLLETQFVLRVKSKGIMPQYVGLSRITHNSLLDWEPWGRGVSISLN